MRVWHTLLRRELGGYLLSLTGYVIITAVAFLLGVGFTLVMLAYNGDSLTVPLTELFHSTLFFWLILLVATPVITMRSFAQEHFSGTYETLMTCPVGDAQIVLAKYAAAFVFYVLMWLPLLACLQVVHRQTAGGAPFDWWPAASTGLGILLMGALYLAMGCLASALTRSQIVAAILSFAMGLTLFLLSFAKAGLGARAGWMADAASYLSMVEHMEDFVRGVVDTRRLVFYLSLSGLFLFLSVKVVEARRWK
ncbi:MAG: ABC transporter permease [Verrucomicrobiales bacterium]|nr:ABC transporter permease [Verrucomicrobiales bacterium]